MILTSSLLYITPDSEEINQVHITCVPGSISTHETTSLMVQNTVFVQKSVNEYKYHYYKSLSKSSGNINDSVQRKVKTTTTL